MLSVCSVRLCALHCVSIDFVCMHLLLDQFFNNFLKFPKMKQLLTLSLSRVSIFAHFPKQHKTREIWNT